MIETKIVTKQVVTEELIDILCNMCGRSCRSHVGPNYLGQIETSVQGCFESKVPPDMVEYIYSLCEDCLGALIEKFKFPPAKRDATL